MKKSALYIAVAAGLLSACNPLAANTQKEIVGKWENPEWGTGRNTLWVTFYQDGAVGYHTSLGNARAEWSFLDSGELQITHPNGSQQTCRAKIDGEVLTLGPPMCFLAWDEIGESVQLKRQ